MRAYVLLPLLIGAAILASLGVLYVAIPMIGVERANRAANTVLMVGGLGLMVGAGWTVWKLLGR